MSALQFTPGPWDFARKPHGDGYATVVFDQSGLPIAVVSWYAISQPGGVTATNREQNARLISKAPELFAACEKSLQMMIAERDCLYDGVTNADGEYHDDEDREAVDYLDSEIDQLQRLVAAARGGVGISSYDQQQAIDALRQAVETIPADSQVDDLVTGATIPNAPIHAKRLRKLAALPWVIDEVAAWLHELADLVEGGAQ